MTKMAIPNRLKPKEFVHEQHWEEKLGNGM